MCFGGHGEFQFSVFLPYFLYKVFIISFSLAFVAKNVASVVSLLNLPPGLRSIILLISLAFVFRFLVHLVFFLLRIVCVINSKTGGDPKLWGKGLRNCDDLPGT